MQKKIGTLLDDDLVKKAKEAAFVRHTTLNRIFEEALREYLSRQGAGRKLSGVESSFGAMKLSPNIVRMIAHEDIYDAE